MQHFYERLDRENNYQYEYEKLEHMIYFERIQLRYSCLYELIEEVFRKWKKRENYISFDEMRKAVGFDNGYAEGYYRQVTNIDIKEFVVYCEMISSVLWGIIPFLPDSNVIMERISEIIHTIDATLNKAGLERKLQDDLTIIVEQNAAAVYVADKYPDLADIMIEYNQFLLRGDLDRKREILVQIIHKLEPKRQELSRLNKVLENDFFGLANNADLRHNNVSEESKEYNQKFAAMTNKEKEEIYDLTYEQSLAAFLVLGQPERDRKCRQFFKKTSLCGEQEEEAGKAG